jgi:RasGEF domain
MLRVHVYLSVSVDTCVESVHFPNRCLFLLLPTHTHLLTPVHTPTQHNSTQFYPSQAWTKAKTRDTKAANVVRMIRRYNLGAEWVVAMVLRAPNHAVRVKTVQRFIDICEELMELGNLNSILMILSSFSAVPVYRLKSVWEGRPGFKGISVVHQDKLQRLRDATSGDRNRAAYRETFSKLPSPKLPFLGVYLTDLTFVDEGNTPFLPKER